MFDLEKRKKAYEKRLREAPKHVSPTGDVTRPHISRMKFEVAPIDRDVKMVSAKEFWFGRKPG